MPTNFGTQTDHFSLASSDLILIDSNDTPIAKSIGDALDAVGDSADRAYYGAGSLRDVTCTYSLITGTLDLATLFLGELSAGVVANAITVTPGAGATPKIEVSGQLGTVAVVTPTGILNKWALPEITISAMMAAQPMGFTVTTGKLQTVSLSASCNLAREDDGAGEPAAHGVNLGVCQVTATLTATSTAVPAIAAVSPFTIMQPLSTVEPQGGWRTGSFTLDAVLTRAPII